ncbi:MAG: hypothetical protein H0T62_04520 [Parachlamydiaceae bacterium]|nr:hypothetical protein [Parachlamydiaceae bacterium]
MTRLLFSAKKQLLNSWWVFFFALLCFICYEQGIKRQNIQFQTLMKQLKELQHEKATAMSLHTELSAQILSQTDLDWIELTLMKELGVVPEGQRKVFFNE